jgi:hypothetical protein
MRNPYLKMIALLFGPMLVGAMLIPIFLLLFSLVGV